MRMLRMWLTGTVIVVLLGGLGGAALAQDEQDTPEPSSPVAFTAHMRMDASIEPYSLEFLDDYVAYRDQVERWTVTEASDSRLSGDVVIVASVRNYQEPSDLWLARRVARIESADGAWQGRPTSEYWLWYRGLPFTMVFTGEGAYEGWTILALATPQTGTQIDLEGHIVEGRLPAAPEIPPQ